MKKKKLELIINQILDIVNRNDNDYDIKDELRELLNG